MGKYLKSRLNDKYSDWHWQNGRFRRDSFLTDVDRIWIEIRDGKPMPIAVFDIKEPEAQITWAENIAYNWFEEKGLPVYIITTTEEFKDFTVRRWGNGKSRHFNQEQYVNFINDLRNSIF